MTGAKASQWKARRDGGRSSPDRKFTSMSRPSYSVQCNVVKPRTVSQTVTEQEADIPLFDIKEYEKQTSPASRSLSPKGLVAISPQRFGYGVRSGSISSDTSVFRDHWKSQNSVDMVTDGGDSPFLGSVRTRPAEFMARQGALDRTKRLSKSMSSLDMFENRQRSAFASMPTTHKTQLVQTQPKQTRKSGEEELSIDQRRHAFKLTKNGSFITDSMDIPSQSSPLPPNSDKELLEDEALYRNRLGSIQLSICYLSRENTLRVIVMRALKLPDISKGTAPNAFVKVVLLPDKSAKCKTRVIRRMRDPAFNEEFRFSDYTLSWLQQAKLKVQVS